MKQQTTNRSSNSNNSNNSNSNSNNNTNSNNDNNNNDSTNNIIHKSAMKGGPKRARIVHIRVGEDSFQVDFLQEHAAFQGFWEASNF